MASPNLKIRWVPGSLRTLRNSDGVMNDLDARAARVAAAAEAQSGKTYGWESHATVPSPQGRGRATVWPIGIQAIVDNMKNNTLLKAIDSGR